MIVFAKEIEKRKESSRQARTSRGSRRDAKHSTTQHKRYYANTESRNNSYEEYPALATYQRPGIAERVVGFFERIVGDTAFPAYTEPAFVLDPLPAGDAPPVMGRGWGGAKRASDWQMLTRPLSKMAPKKDYVVDPRLSEMRPQPAEESRGTTYEKGVQRGYPGNQKEWEAPKKGNGPNPGENVRGYQAERIEPTRYPQTPPNPMERRETAVQERFAQRSDSRLGHREEHPYQSEVPARVHYRATKSEKEVSKRHDEGVDQGREARHAGLGGNAPLYPERKYNVGG